MKFDFDPQGSKSPEETNKYYFDTIMSEASEKLNDFETKFMAGIEEKVMLSKLLTPKQEAYLESLYNRFTR